MIDKLNHEYVTLVVEPEDTLLVSIVNKDILNEYITLTAVEPEEDTNNGMLEKLGDGWMVTNGYSETYGFKEHDVIDIDVNCKIIYLRG